MPRLKEAAGASPVPQMNGEQMAAPEPAPDLINTLYAAALRLEKAAANARTIAEQLTAGAAEARRAYEAASRTADGSGCGRGPRDT
ncbi:hypothetical protein [Streptomyces paromomycinus]